MKTHQAPSHPMPAVGQLWDYVDEFKFMNITGESFMVIDVTDNVVYYALQGELIYRDGAFHNLAVIRESGGVINFVNEEVTFKRGYPNKPLFMPVNFKKLRLDLFQKEFHCVSELITVYEYSEFSLRLQAIASKLKSKFFQP